MRSTIALRCMMISTACLAFVDCNEPGDSDSMQRSAITQALYLPRLPDLALLFQNTSTMLDLGPDWDPNYGKASCPPGQTLHGISEVPGGQGRQALCEPANNGMLSGNTTAILNLDARVDQRRATRMTPSDIFPGDWAFECWKLECGENEYVSGVSEDADSTEGDNRFHAIRCAAGTGLTDNCSVRIFNGGDDRGTTATGDWDIGAFKGECALNEYVAGVSVVPSTGSPASLLCCQMSVTCPPGQTLLDQNRCVTLTPWDGSPLENGARIAMMAAIRTNEYAGGEQFGPSWVKLTNFAVAGGTAYDYLDASGTELTSDAIFTVMTLPRGPREFMAGNFPPSYQKLMIQSIDWLYLGIDSIGNFASMAPDNDPPILILDLTQGTRATFYFSGFSLSQNPQMMTDTSIVIHGSDFLSFDGHTVYRSGNDGLTGFASFFEMFIVQ